MLESKAKISLRVYANASKNEVVSFTDGVLRIRVAAPPVRGKANRELLAFLSRALGIRKDALTIVKGQTSQNKAITVDGLSQPEVMRRLFSSSGDATG